MYWYHYIQPVLCILHDTTESEELTQAANISRVQVQVTSWVLGAERQGGQEGYYLGGCIWKWYQSPNILGKNKHFLFSCSSSQQSIIESLPWAKREAGRLQQCAPSFCLQEAYNLVPNPGGSCGFQGLWDIKEVDSDSQIHTLQKHKALRLCANHQLRVDGAGALSPWLCLSGMNQG